jgi:multiple sugar transport system substrate-binding protein
MKKILFLLCALSLIGSYVFAGGNQASSSAGKTVVSILQWGSISEEPDVNIVQYEKDHPGITIDLVVVPYEDYPQKLATVQAAGALPDILHLEEHRVLEFGSLGIYKDLRAEFTARGLNIDDHYIAGQLFKSGNKVYGTGAAGSMNVMFYNKKLLREAGVAFPPNDVTKPWNWDQYLLALQKLTKDNQGRTPLDAGFNVNNVVQWGTTIADSWIFILPWLYAAGTSMANAEGTALEITKPLGMDAIQKYADLTTKYHVAAPVGTFPSREAALMNDQIAIMFQGNWGYGSYSLEGYDVGFAQIPAISGKGSNMVWGAGSGLTNKASSAAFDYYYWAHDTARDIANLETWNATHPNEPQQQYSGIPLTKNVTTDPALKARLDKLSNPAYTQLLSDIADKGSRMGENLTLKNFTAILEEHVFPAIQLVRTGDATAQEAFRNLDANTKSLFQGIY